MELRVYLDFLHRRWWLLVLGPVLAGLAAFFVTSQLTPVYQASTTILVNKTAIPGVIDYNDILTSERLTNTYAQLVERPAVLDDVIKRLDLKIDRTALEHKISVTPIKDTQLLSLDVKDKDPKFAATLANITATAFAENTAAEIAPTGNGTVVVAKPADVPQAPISPKLMFNVVFAVFLGAVVSVGLALLLDYLDDTVKSSEDIESVAGLPTLGMISRFRPETGPAVSRDRRSRSAEAYRQLRTNVHFTSLGSELKTIVITSANPDEGKSTTAANLATVLAQAGDRVILVDTDLRRSSLRKAFDVGNSFGLTGLLLNDIQDPSLALVATRWKNLQLLPAGVLPPNPSELLTSARMIRVIQMLRQMADYVIFDSPPILAVTDAIVLAARTDGTILVTEVGGTRNEALRQASRTLKQANARVIGVVLNKAKVSIKGDYYYREDQVVQPAIEISPERPAPRLPVNQSLPATPAVAITQGRDSVLEQRLAALRGTRPEPVAAGSRPATSDPQANIGAAVTETAPLSAAMTDLLSHLDDTVGLIRSLKPNGKGEDS